MSLNVMLMESPCVKWKTALPGLNKSCVSPVFNLKESPLHFKLDSYFDNEEQQWRVHLAPWTALGNIHILLCIEKANGQLPYLRCKEFTCDHKVQFEPLLTFGRSLLTNSGITEDVISMVFVFHFESYPGNVIKGVEAALEKPLIQPSCLQSLTEDMRKLFDNEEHSDAVLKCGDRSFFVNRKILSVRSEVFEAMFRNKMSEKETGVVDITDIKPDVLEQFLRYVYSGKLDALNMDSVFDLYRAGDKYALPSLKRKCASFLVENLSEENVCEVLSLASTFRDNELLNITEHFALTIDGFLKSTKWNDFATADPGAAVGVYKKFITIFSGQGRY